MKRAISIICIILALLLLASGISVWLSYHWLTVTHFAVSSDKISEPVRIVLVSDLHDHEFGQQNEKLIREIEAQKPDLIVLDGDMLNDNSPDSHVPVDLVSGLQGIAPVYYALGNHERSYMQAGHPELLSELEAAGAIIMSHNVEDLEIRGNRIQLGGIYEYAFETSMQDAESSALAVEYMERYTAEADDGEYKLMLAHRPESLYCFQFADKLWHLDLVLSGHLHGGQVIVPFVGGLYSSLEDWFPNYDYGQFEIGSCTMVITRGLSSNPKALPRLNNPPEVVVIDLKPMAM